MSADDWSMFLRLMLLAIVLGLIWEGSNPENWSERGRDYGHRNYARGDR